MRRTDREITDKKELLTIMQQCQVCRLALTDTPVPYIVPLSFGFEETGESIDLYFHCANAGKKLDLLQTTPYAAFEMDCNCRFILGEPPCASTTEFASLCGSGKVEILPPAKKAHGLNIIMAHYTGDTQFDYLPKSLAATTVLRLHVQQMTGKRLEK